MSVGVYGSAYLPNPGGVIRSPAGRSYLVGERLGDGSFGAVFDCIGPFDQAYALKVLQPSGRSYHEVREDWVREVSRLYQLRHPHIVYVHDYFEAGGLLYLVLERCDHSLEDMLGTPFTDRLVVELARQLLFAIQYLNDNEIVHNDLHAGNILVTQGDRITLKISDLGIAQELHGAPSARPALVHHRIMAPEVAAGGYTTKQSDLYQLGLLMYFMHTGEPAIDFSLGYEEIVSQIREGVPRVRAEALGTPLSGIISVMLRRQEQYRYASPIQVWEDLRRLDLWRPSLSDPLSQRSPASGPTGTLPPVE